VLFPEEARQASYWGYSKER